MAWNDARTAQLYILLRIPTNGTLTIFSVYGPWVSQLGTVTASINVSAIKSLIDTNLAALPSATKDELEAIVTAFKNANLGSPWSMINGGAGSVRGLNINSESQVAMWAKQAENILGVAGLGQMIDDQSRLGNSNSRFLENSR